MYLACSVCLTGCGVVELLYIKWNILEVSLTSLFSHSSGIHFRLLDGLPQNIVQTFMSPEAESSWIWWLFLQRPGMWQKAFKAAEFSQSIHFLPLAGPCCASKRKGRMDWLLFVIHNALWEVLKTYTMAKSKCPPSGLVDWDLVDFSRIYCDVFAVITSSLQRLQGYITCWWTGVTATIIQLILIASIATSYIFPHHDVVEYYFCPLRFK